MFCEAHEAGLSFDVDKVRAILGGESPYAPPSARGPLHQSLHGWWWLGEIWPKRYYHSVTVPGQTTPEWKPGITVNLGRPRLIPEGVRIHQSVFDRMQADAQYRPRNLPPAYVTEPESDCEKMGLEARSHR
jgi:hypothetical protein